jgi:hypothetical protein
MRNFMENSLKIHQDLLKHTSTEHPDYSALSSALALMTVNFRHDDVIEKFLGGCRTHQQQHEDF